MHPGKFYALPQAPQQYQAAADGGRLRPLFPDRALLPRRRPARRPLPGEFYQLDLEMSFVTQEDVFETMEPVSAGVFEEFRRRQDGDAGGQFPRIPLRRGDAEIRQRQARSAQPARSSPTCREHFRELRLRLFAKIVARRRCVRAIPAPGRPASSRKFFDEMNDWARGEGHAGPRLYHAQGRRSAGRSPRTMATKAARRSPRSGWGRMTAVLRRGQGEGGGQAGRCRTHARGGQLELIEQERSACAGSSTSRSTNMTRTRRRSNSRTTRSRCRRAAWRRWRTKDPLTIKAYQYDLVCNGYRDCVGAIRNHRPELMVKAFELVGLSKPDVDRALRRPLSRVPVRRAAAWRHGRGRRPHRHAAGGAQNLREVIAVPDEPACRGPADGGAVARVGAAAARAVDPSGDPAAGDGQRRQGGGAERGVSFARRIDQRRRVGRCRGWRKTDDKSSPARGRWHAVGTTEGADTKPMCR